MIRLVGFVIDGARVTLTLLMLAVIRCYQLGISPWLPSSCRHRPTCSRYAAEAIVRYGPLTGGWKALRRIARCHPWSPGGWDPP